MLLCPACLLSYVLSCLTCLVPYVFLCLMHLVLTCSRAFCASYHTCSGGCLRCIAQYVFDVPLAFRALVPYMARSLRALVAHVPCILHALVPHVSYVFLYLTYFVPCLFLCCLCFMPYVLLCSSSLTCFRCFKSNMLML